MDVNLLMLKRDIIEHIIPEDDWSVPFISGYGGSYGSEVQIIASTTFPFILCGAYIYEHLWSDLTGANRTVLNIRVKTGPGGSAVPIAESSMALMLQVISGTGLSIRGLTGHTHRFAPTLIPTGTRLSVDASCTLAASADVAVGGAIYLVGYDAREWALPLQYLRDQIAYMKGLMVQAQSTLTYPAPGTLSLTRGGTWVYGTAVEFVASATSPLLITGAVAGSSIVDDNAQLKIGLGAGNGTSHSKVGFPTGGSMPGPMGTADLIRPLFVLPGERVSARVACSAAGAVNIGLRGIALK